MEHTSPAIYADFCAALTSFLRQFRENDASVCVNFLAQCASSGVTVVPLEIERSLVKDSEGQKRGLLDISVKFVSTKDGSEFSTKIISKGF